MVFQIEMKNAILIFVVPPSFEVLKSRLVGRNTESHEVILKRLAIAESELEKAKEFNYKVINDDLETALSDLETIIVSERNKK